MKYYPKTAIAIICIVILIVSIAAFVTSCGNHSIGIGEHEWSHLHYCTFGGESGCATIEKWYESGSGIEVKTTEFGSIFLSEGTYILISDSRDCPFCNKDGK